MREHEIGVVFDVVARCVCVGAQQTAMECLKQALRDTKDACEVVKSTFIAENEIFRNQ